MQLYVSKGLNLFALLIRFTVVTSIVHAVVSRACTIASHTHFLVDMHLFHEDEALLLGKAGASSAKPYKREYLVIPDNRANFAIILLIWIATEQKCLNHVLLQISIQRLIGYLFPELNNHFSAYQFKHLVDPKRSF